MYYTLGQRRGFGVGGVHGSEQSAWYVLEKDMSRNVLVIGQGHDHPGLFSNALEAGTMDWCNNQAPSSSFQCQAKIRYRQEDQSCTVEPLAEDRYRVVFDVPQRSITPGQSVVFYQNGECLGGGIIEQKFFQS
jgi:tRNA-specific 2-thiouridylase